MKKDLLLRVNELIELANKAIATTVTPSGMGYPSVNGELFHNFRAASLSFINNLYGVEHSYYKNFDELAHKSTPHCTENARGLLKAIKTELEGGWIFTIKDLVSAEIFSDFLEMAEYLLKEKYKDAAAVMIGSVLEESLRQICIKNSIDVETIKDGKPNPKKADTLNSDLASSAVYNKLDQKSITSWLDLRNKAAHGKYDEYTIEQVNVMYLGVTNFISRMSES